MTILPLCLVALKLFHAEPHDVLHLVQDFEVHVFVGLFRVNLVQNALLTDVLTALELEKLRRGTALTLVLTAFMASRLLSLAALPWCLLFFNSRCEHLAESTRLLKVFG